MSRRKPDEYLMDYIPPQKNGKNPLYAAVLFAIDLMREGQVPDYANGGAERAHRFSYKHYRKIDPLDLMVCHRCDNPSCVNPDHLFLGTCQDNLRDALQKGRFAIGDLNGRSKLTHEQVKKLLQSPESGASLAKKWGVNRSTINRIRRGEGWRNV